MYNYQPIPTFKEVMASINHNTPDSSSSSHKQQEKPSIRISDLISSSEDSVHSSQTQPKPLGQVNQLYIPQYTQSIENGYSPATQLPKIVEVHIPGSSTQIGASIQPQNTHATLMPPVHLAINDHKLAVDPAVGSAVLNQESPSMNSLKSRKISNLSSSAFAYTPELYPTRLPTPLVPSPTIPSYRAPQPSYTATYIVADTNGHSQVNGNTAFHRPVMTYTSNPVDPYSRILPTPTVAQRNMYADTSTIVSQNYNASTSHVSRQSSASLETQRNLMPDQPVKKKRKTGTKDPDAPKHPMSPFLFFLAEIRPRYTAMYPGSKVGPISKMISQEWKNMPPESKKLYERKALEDKVRYAKEMEIYLAKKHGAIAV